MPSSRPPLGDTAQLNGTQDDLENVNPHLGSAKTVDRRVYTKKSVADLKADLARVQERFEKQSDAPKDSSRPIIPSDSFEAKLQDLVKKHQASKIKHHTELAALQEANRKITEESDKAQREVTEAKAENARLLLQLQLAKGAQTNALAESAKEKDTMIQSLRAEVKKMEKEAEIAKMSFKAITRENRKKWEEEKRILMREMEILQNENDRLIGREDHAEKMEDGRDRMEEWLHITAAECGRYRLTMLPREVYARVRNERDELRMESITVKSRSDAFRQELRCINEEKEMWKVRAAEAEQGRRDADTMLHAILEERRQDRAYSAPRPSIDNGPALVNDTDHYGLDGLEVRHQTLEFLAVQVELRDTLLALRRVHEELSQTSKTLMETKGSLRILQHDHTSLSEKCSALETEHARRAQQIKSLEQEVVRWQHAEQTLSVELTELKTEHERLTMRWKGDKESLKRANDTVMRSKSAEDAFEQEILQLREALDEASQYQDLYNDLVEENRLLSFRAKLAADEADRLGEQNSELLGHANGDQKISYVDSLRREMALTKHELASARSQLNRANETLSQLKEEVEAYKNVDLRTGQGSSMRTRVVRRVPEGSWLGASTSRRSTMRSVSGPVTK